MKIITVSREFGSGGREIGKHLAEKLQVRCYDRELITLAAQKAEVREELFAGKEEKAPNPWLFTGVYEGGAGVRKGQPAEDILFEVQSQVILELAQMGPYIIVGRCADAVLRAAGIPTVSLFICAPFADRVRRRMEREHLSQKAAEELAEAKPAEPAKQPSAPKRVKSEQGIIVEGLDNCLVKFSKCCTPVPGDDIIGFITRGYGVSVHRCDCPNASAERRSAPGQEGRWIKVSWGVDTLDSYPTSLEVICKDRRNLLLDISAALSTTNTSVSALNSRSTEDNFAMIHMEVKVRDNAHLLSVMNKLNQISGVLKVNRPAG